MEAGVASVVGFTVTTSEIDLLAHELDARAVIVTVPEKSFFQYITPVDELIVPGFPALVPLGDTEYEIVLPADTAV